MYNSTIISINNNNDDDDDNNMQVSVSTCGHWLGRLTRLRSRTSATQLMMNCSSKLELSPTTFYTHFCHHHPLHHRTMV